MKTPLGFSPFLTLPLALMLAIGIGCGKQPQQQAAPPEEDIVMEGWAFTLVDSGKQKLEVRSEIARMPEDQSIARLEGVKIVQLQDGSSSGTITAREGTYFAKDAPKAGRKSQDLLLKGSVMVKHPNGFTLSSDEALIEGMKERLVATTNSRFRVPVEGGRIIEGRAMHFELELMGGFETVNFRLGTEEMLAKPNRKNLSSLKISGIGSEEPGAIAKAKDDAQ